MLKDRWLWAALVAGSALRLIPMWIWPQTECVRDECIYRFLAQGILKNGELGLSTKGWLSAPGYPWSMAFSQRYLGSFYTLKWFQIALSVSSILVIYAIAKRLAAPDGEDRARRAGRWAAWLLALHPTIAWYSNTWWIETIYIGFLLPAIYALLRAREPSGRPWLWGFAAGVSLGICVLYRGIATFLPPLFLLALLWPAEGLGPWLKGLRSGRSGLERRWLKPAAALLLGSVLTVGPYSVYATQKYGGFIVSDATVGHVMHLGNNDFPPLTFDYGNGVLTQPLYYTYIGQGRKWCRRRGVPPAQAVRCDVRQSLDWIRDHPGEFVSRIPMRLAQQLNPHSFLTRHLRWGYWRGLPWELKELFSLWIASTTVLVVLGGTLAGFARGRGPYAVVAGGTIAHTMLAAAAMYGMSRFRLPLEPLLILWLAVFLANPTAGLDALRRSWPRAVAVVLTLPVLVGLMAWYAPTGFPAFWR